MLRGKKIESYKILKTKEDITALYIDVPYNTASKYVTQNPIELPGKPEKPTIIIWGFNSPSSVIDRSSRQKISIKIVELNSTINQPDVIEIHQLFQQQQYVHSSLAQVVIKREHILGHRAQS